MLYVDNRTLYSRWQRDTQITANRLYPFGHRIPRSCEGCRGTLTMRVLYCPTSSLVSAKTDTKCRGSQ